MLNPAQAIAPASGMNGGTQSAEAPRIAYTGDLYQTTRESSDLRASSFLDALTDSQPYVPVVHPIVGASVQKASSLFDPCSCVSYVKAKRPDQTEPWGSPNKVQAFDLVPRKGLIVITTEGRIGHAAYIESVDGEAMTVSEANFSKCSVTSRRIPISAEFIRGYR